MTTKPHILTSAGIRLGFCLVLLPFSFDASPVVGWIVAGLAVWVVVVTIFQLINSNNQQ